MQWSFVKNKLSTILRGRRNILAAGIGLSAICIAGMLLFTLRKPALATETLPDVAVTGWHIELMGDFAGPGGKEFSGNFTSSKILFLPAGAEFSVIAQPANARGELVSPTQANTRATWETFGGALNVGVPLPGGSRQMARAPSQPGLYRLVWQKHQNSAVMLLPASATNTPGSSTTPVIQTLDILVLTRAEAEKRGDRTLVKVNGKSIGGYHDPLKASVKRVRENAAQYQVPQFFATLNAETVRLRLGPNFELGDLIAFKDYVGADGKKVFTTERHTDVFPLRPELVEKLIKLRERLRQNGIKITRFGVTSAFRTPDYNKSIGGAQFSRHCYGDAIDLYVDEDGNHKMDDVNGDGRIDRKDGLVIANACREIEAEGSVTPGGIGLYEWDGDESVRSHVHVDCRGYISRWGQLGSGRHKKTFKWWPAAEFQDEENGE